MCKIQPLEPLMRHRIKYTVSDLITEGMDHLTHRC